MEDIILSVIISTYNRSELLMKNLKTMLRCKSNEVEFIVGDNASTDRTFDEISKIKDQRVRIFRNEENLGFENQRILTQYARGEFLMMVNDRDYIKSRDLDWTISFLKRKGSKKDIDVFLGFNWRNYKDGEYSGREAYELVIAGDHPGRRIWRTSVYQSTTDYKALTEVSKNRDTQALLLGEMQNIIKVRKVYLINKCIVTLYKDASKLPQTRKEHYIKQDESSFGVKHKNKVWLKWRKELENYSDNKIKKDILLAEFQVMQRKIMIDYYHGFLAKPEFAKRQGVKTMTKWDCVKNGVLHLAFVLKYLEKTDDKLEYFKVTGRNYMEMICSWLRV